MNLLLIPLMYGVSAAMALPASFIIMLALGDGHSVATSCPALGFLAVWAMTTAAVWFIGGLRGVGINTKGGEK